MSTITDCTMHISHEGNKLHIAFPYQNAAMDHEGLAKGIITAMKLALLSGNDSITNSEREDLIPLIDLLRGLIPDEIQLEKAYGK